MQLRYHRRYVKSTINNYILLYIIKSSMHSRVSGTPETQVDNDKTFLQGKSNGTQMEQRLYLAHCCIYPIAGNLCKCHGIAAFSEFCVRNEKACVRQPEKVIRNQESMWTAIHECFIYEMLYFNQFRKFSLAKVPKYSID